MKISFIAIGKAFSVLSDSRKREQYDQYGNAMEPQYQRGNNTGGRQHYYYCDEDEDFSAEEIFNMFFGHAGMRDRILKKKPCFEYLGGATRTYRRRQQPNSFHFTTNSPQNVCFISNSFTEINLPFSLDNTYTCPIITVFIFISYFHSRNIIGQ